MKRGAGVATIASRAYVASLCSALLAWAPGCGKDEDPLRVEPDGGGSTRAGGAGGEAGQGISGSAGESGAGGDPVECVAAAVTASKPSCENLVPSCGPDGSDDCCATSLVTGGTFNRSSDPGYPATVCDFGLDDYEVTVARFRRFVQAYPEFRLSAGAGKNANDAADPGWDEAWNDTLPADRDALVREDGLGCGDRLHATWTDEPGDNENRPVNCLTWFEALAFCIWDGGRLPTEAEWNYAAAGGDQQRVFPWSDPPGSTTVDPSLSSYYADDDQRCQGDGVAGCDLTDLIEVGSKPAGNGRFGQADLGGNVWEWVLDMNGVYPLPCNNCSQLEGHFRVLRGGSYNYLPEYQETAFRYGYGLEAETRETHIGVRCARGAP